VGLWGFKIPEFGLMVKTFVHAIANSSVHYSGQEVHQTDPETFVYNLTHTHKQCLKIEEDIEFQRGINIKKN
jgi:hypothetical protein